VEALGERPHGRRQLLERRDAGGIHAPGRVDGDPTLRDLAEQVVGHRETLGGQAGRVLQAVDAGGPAAQVVTVTAGHRERRSGGQDPRLGG
jgi:hypothetical protein